MRNPRTEAVQRPKSGKTTRHYAARMLASGVLLSSILAGCGLSSSGESAGTGPVVIGVITSETGPLASTVQSKMLGFMAEVDSINAAGGVNGRMLKIEIADDQSTVTGNLAAAKSLVEFKHVFAVAEISVTAAGTYGYLDAAGVPTVRTSSDISPGLSSIFSIYGVMSSNQKSFATTFGQFMKTLGVHHVASMGVGANQAAAVNAENALDSARYAGLSGGYLNTTLPATVTSWTPYVIAMKSAAVDGFIAPMSLQQSLALLTAARQQGLTLKSLLEAGYDRAVLTQPTNVIVDGQYVDSPLAPVELNTAATQRFASVMKKYGDVPVSINSEQGYVAGLLLKEGLLKAGAALSRKSFIDGLNATSDWDAGGLAPKPVNYTLQNESDKATKDGLGPGNCVWFLKIQGTQFVPVSKEPVCGQVISSLGS